MIGDFIATIARAFRRVLLPLAAYYAVTVAIPLANGANRPAQSGPTFWPHTLAVLVVPPVIVVLVCIGYTIAGALVLKSDRKSGHPAR